MGIKFGEIDAAQIVDNEFRIGVLERLLEWILSQNATLVRPTPEDLTVFRQQAIEVLQRKYPNSGIAYKET